MPNNPNNPNYTVTPALLARARADIDRRREQLNESHDAALAVIAARDNAIAALDLELAEIDACERTATAIVERYAAPPGSKRTPKGKVRPARSGKPYTTQENERILEAAATRGQMEKLAGDTLRTYNGVLKQHEALLNRAERDQGTPSDSPAVEEWVDEVEEAAISEQPPALAGKSTHETNPAVVSETLNSDPPAACVSARSVTGRLLDNGPLDQRVYDYGAFASRDPG